MQFYIIISSYYNWRVTVPIFHMFIHQKYSKERNEKKNGRKMPKCGSVSYCVEPILFSVFLLKHELSRLDEKERRKRTFKGVF